jgi:hypothetical protein
MKLFFILKISMLLSIKVIVMFFRIFWSFILFYFKKKTNLFFLFFKEKMISCIRWSATPTKSAKGGCNHPWFNQGWLRLSPWHIESGCNHLLMVLVVVSPPSEPLSDYLKELLVGVIDLTKGWSTTHLNDYYYYFLVAHIFRVMVI